ADIDGDGWITFRDLRDPQNQGPGKIVDVDQNGRIDALDILSPSKQDGTGGWADGVSNNGDTYVDDLVGWNFIDNNNRPLDNHGHGTHIAGVIGAMANNGVGIAGLSWNALLVPLKFMNSGNDGSVSSVIAAIDYAVDMGTPVSNNSWGGEEHSEALREAIERARDHGHIFVAAAGNGGADSL